MFGNYARSLDHQSRPVGRTLWFETALSNGEFHQPVLRRLATDEMADNGSAICRNRERSLSLLYCLKAVQLLERLVVHIDLSERFRQGRGARRPHLFHRSGALARFAGIVARPVELVVGGTRRGFARQLIRVIGAGLKKKRGQLRSIDARARPPPFGIEFIRPFQVNFLARNGRKHQPAQGDIAVAVPHNGYLFSIDARINHDPVVGARTSGSGGDRIERLRLRARVLICRLGMALSYVVRLSKGRPRRWEDRGVSFVLSVGSAWNTMTTGANYHTPLASTAIKPSNGMACRCVR